MPVYPSVGGGVCDDDDSQSELAVCPGGGKLWCDRVRPNQDLPSTTDSRPDLSFAAAAG